MNTYYITPNTENNNIPKIRVYKPLPGFITIVSKMIQIFLLIIISITYSCSNNTPINQGSLTDSLLNDTSVNTVFLLPPPDDIINDIFTKRIALNPELVTPLQYSYKLINEKNQSIGLGIYIADLAFLNFAGSNENIIEYFKNIKELSDKLNIYNLIGDSFFDRVNNNLLKKDSLALIINEMYYHFSEVLESSNRQKTLALISAGAIIETLYLSVMVIENYKDYTQAVQNIFHQQQLVDSYTSLIGQYSSDDEIKAVQIELVKLKEILDESVLSNKRLIIKKDSANHFTIRKQSDIKVTPKNFDEFKANVIVTHKSLINLITKEK